MEIDFLDNAIMQFINGTYDNNIYPVKYSVSQSLSNDNNKYIYNEFSFQHELGCYLRKILEEKNYNIKFELNVKKEYKIKSCKSECDIFILDNNNNARYAIELKYLKQNCAEPRRMFQCAEDMQFMNDVLRELKSINKTYCIVITENKRLYQGNSNRDKQIIYSHIEHLDKNLNNIKYKSCTEEIKTQLKYLKEISDNYTNSKKYPTIYDFFRENNKESWREGKYIYSQLKKDIPVIRIDSFVNKIKEIEWKNIKNTDEKYKYYILSFKRS